MRAARLVATRAVTRRPLLLSLGAVVAITAFLLSGMLAYLAGAGDTAVREALTSGPPTSVAVQVTSRLADDSDQQTDAIEHLINDAFTQTDVTVHRTVRSTPVDGVAAGQQVELIFTADSGITERGSLVTGDWPSEAGGVAVHAAAADALGLSVGDEVLAAGAAYRVSATWVPRDATDPYWFADPATASGRDQLSFGPLVAAEQTVAALPVRSYARWTITPTATALTADGLPQLASSLDELELAVDRASGQQNVELAGSLRGRVEHLQRSLGVAEALVIVPAVLVAVIGLVTLGQLARLLVAARRTETALIRARGGSVVQLTLVSLGEVLATVVPGAALGVLGVLLSPTLLPPNGAALNGAALTAAVWPVGFAIAASAVAVCGVVSWRAAVTGTAGVRGETGRARSSVSLVLTVLAAVAAALSLWQFKLYGSPLVTGQDGVVSVDPLTVVAPGLTLLALAMLGLLAFSPVLRVVERWVAQKPGIIPVLPMRQLARRAPVFGVAMLLVTLAVSGTTLAALYSQTWSASSTTAARLSNGADVRVQLNPPRTIDPAAPIVSADTYLALTGVDAAATVLTTPVRIADDSAGLTALAVARMHGVMLPVKGAVEPSLIATALASERSGEAVADHVGLTVQVSAPAGQAAGTVEVLVWLEHADGSLALVPVGSVAVAEAGPATLAADVPQPGEWQVLAVEARLGAAEGARDIRVSVSGVGEPHELTLSSTEPSDRSLTYPAASELRVVVTERLASRLGLEVGSTFNARLPVTASPVLARVAGTTPAVPASTERFGLLADLPTLNRYLLAAADKVPQASEVWIASAEPAALVAPAVGVSTTAATVTTTADTSAVAAVAPALVSLWWGMAGAMLLAVIALLAITTTFAQERRTEVVVLRALGLSTTQQARNRLMETSSAVIAATVTGVVTGLTAAVLTVPELSAAAVGSAAPLTFGFDLLGWLSLVLAFLIALLTVLVGYARKVARQAGDAEHRRGPE